MEKRFRNKIIIIIIMMMSCGACGKRRYLLTSMMPDSVEISSRTREAEQKWKLQRNLTPLHGRQDVCSSHPEQTHHCSRSESSRGTMWLQGTLKHSEYEFLPYDNYKKSAWSKACHSTLSSSTRGNRSGFCLGGTLFDLRRLTTKTKSLSDLIHESLFDDECAPVTHEVSDLQLDLDRFSQSAKLSGHTISLEKTGVLHQPAPGGNNTASEITFVSTQLANMESCKYKLSSSI